MRYTPAGVFRVIATAREAFSVAGSEMLVGVKVGVSPDGSPFTDAAKVERSTQDRVAHEKLLISI